MESYDQDSAVYSGTLYEETIEFKAEIAIF